jgi:hypothetical protein
MEIDNVISFLLLIGANIFGVYALYKILQMSYWFFKDRASKEDEL